MSNNENRIKALEIKRDTINAVSCSFCTAKWLQTTLYLQTGFNHSCHHPAAHKISEQEVLSNPAALHNSEYKKKQRAKMLNGERPAECDYCWTLEDQEGTHFSDRHLKTADWWAWERFDEIKHSDPNADVFPAYLEVAFSNACNFACSYCSPDISSTWMKDIRDNGPYPIKYGSHDLIELKDAGKLPFHHTEENPYLDAFWKWFPSALPHLRVFRVTGGEPLMSKDTWAMFDYLDNNPCPELTFSLNTNLDVSDVLIDKLIKRMNNLAGKVKEVSVFTSMESAGKQAEYIRYGLKYNNWIKNVHRVLTETNTNVTMMTTINILALPRFNDFLDFVMELRTTYNTSYAVNRIPLSINYLRWPPHLQCTVLPIEDRKVYSSKYRDFAKRWVKYNSPQQYARLYLEEVDLIERFCAYLEQSTQATEYAEDFCKFVDEYDKRRGTNFKETFPEYNNLHEVLLNV